jgi:hypothetical protein
MTNAISDYKRRDTIIRTSLLAMFGSLRFMVVAPLVVPQPAAGPIAKFKPYRA